MNANTSEPRSPDWFLLDVAAGVICSGGVVAHATEGVWGLACDPYCAGAVRRIEELKSRRRSVGFVLIGDNSSFDEELAWLDPKTRDDVLASWPGPVTWVVPNRRFPDWVAARDGTIAIRIPGHSQARRLAGESGGVLVSTSANPGGRLPARNALAVRRYFGDRIDWLLPGRTGSRDRASEIRSALNARLLRSG